ncbi:FAD-dependent 5-carboxymethylaminomethyl-2-thiouridine(34) oxidoreductase MnmC [Caenimonas sp. SL110]|uniref:FAD-dependent 5-carboxymethylaminomethyl-2-thiouridine(34) oxidoreductase MnmC n=1 Tax=Caenimonas sp. SL110 TaxID=1450524 RepID=UPI00069CD090|nr:FAD-dependent 5-carboxymethylaminomethyl-2-thiouridine(34) oxidoreductase MnmC [Caenimonas sp. SL110]
MAGLEQTGADLMQACGLPAAWAGKAQWRVLASGAGAPMNFLAAWHAWKADPHRPRMLHFLLIEPLPVSADELVRAASSHPELAALADELAAQWFGLMPGSHRLAFEQGRVLLTVHVNELSPVLRRESFVADSVLLGAVDATSVKALSRHCERGARFAALTASQEALRELGRCGFAVPASAQPNPVVAGEFLPAWEPKQRARVRAAMPSTCIVIGAGLAGSAVAASLARRGWDVCVLDSAAQPASGASGAPVAMLAPHFSPDDSMLSKLSRAGVRMTLQQVREHLVEGEDFGVTGVLELREALHEIRAHEFKSAEEPWCRPASGDDLKRAAAGTDAQGLWHVQAAWIKPAALVSAWLAQPKVQWRANCRVARCQRDGDTGEWIVADAHGNELGRAALVVVAAALESGSLAGTELPLQPVRGQISWGTQPTGDLPPFPVNGNGHFIPAVPVAGDTAWFCGSTFDRGDSSMRAREEDNAANHARLRDLLPSAAAAVEHEFTNRSVRAWAGVRCASSNRRPLVGQVQPGLWLSTAMGSRGLTFCVLCAEVLAAQLHDEPLPIEARLANALAPTTPNTPARAVALAR